MRLSDITRAQQLLRQLPDGIGVVAYYSGRVFVDLRDAASAPGDLGGPTVEIGVSLDLVHVNGTWSWEYASRRDATRLTRLRILVGTPEGRVCSISLKEAQRRLTARQQAEG